uniref:Retrotransposon protein, putative, Ty3-gypsy subclass n=1 Tax=Oryza sativa subsp. japonica TaxID=39947 RepID=Q10IH1_ORYSJ|nr:retrotransposon protein, putative, Ty3-gypsy subclass [Oryza sativa Japonica Group]
MLEVEEEDTERLTMTSVHNEVVNARTAMKTTKVAKLRSERATQLQLHVDAAPAMTKLFTPKFSTYGRNRGKLPTFGKCRVSFTVLVRPEVCGRSDREGPSLSLFSSGLGFPCLGKHVSGFLWFISRVGRGGGFVEGKTNPYLRDKFIFVDCPPPLRECDTSLWVYAEKLPFCSRDG